MTWPRGQWTDPRKETTQARQDLEDLRTYGPPWDEDAEALLRERILYGSPEDNGPEW